MADPIDIAAKRAIAKAAWLTADGWALSEPVELQNGAVVHNILTEPDCGAPLAEYVLPNQAAFIVDASTGYMQALDELEDLRKALASALAGSVPRG